MEELINEDVIKIVSIIISALIAIITTIYSFLTKNQVKQISNNINEVADENKKLQDEVESSIKSNEQLNGELSSIKVSLEDSQKLIKIITDVVFDSVAIAETSGAITGQAKKLIASSKIIQECMAEGVDYNKNQKFIDYVLERLIDVTNCVNTNKGEME